MLTSQSAHDMLTKRDEETNENKERVVFTSTFILLLFLSAPIDVV
jgi:hypothetical protein